MRHTQVFKVTHESFVLGMFKMVEAIAEWKKEHPKAVYLSDEKKEIAKFNQDIKKNVYTYTVKYVYEEN